MIFRALCFVFLFACSAFSLDLPTDYREWIYLSTGLGMNYGPAGAPAAANPAFDNVFVNRPAYQQFLKTGTWPDKTMFVLEIRSSASEGSINHGGHYQTGVNAVEAEVKENGQWTFYGFGNGTTGKAFPRTERCYSCHAENGAVDNTFVQFYPTLLPVAKQKGTYKEPKPVAQLSPAFAAHTIAEDLKKGYQVVAADLNRDGRPDLIALGQGMPDLVWYENPTWERHVLASNLPQMINCAAQDIDGDGIPEIVIAWDFANDAAKSVGSVGVLRHDGDPRRPWQLTKIDAIPTSHRIRWADIEGRGRKVAVNAVLTGRKASPPDYAGDRAPIVMYQPGEWNRQVVSESNQGVQHGISVVRWDPGDMRDTLLTASFSGIHRLQYKGGAWERTQIAQGDPSPCPKCGSSDVALGHRQGERFLAAIEPWHGNQVVVYSEAAPNQWTRLPIDDSLTDGHTILAADFDHDGTDEIVAGFRGGEKSVFLYKMNGTHWEKRALDDTGTGAASCIAADLNADGALDIACISSGALKWYENRGHGEAVSKLPSAKLP